MQGVNQKCASNRFNNVCHRNKNLQPSTQKNAYHRPINASNWQKKKKNSSSFSKCKLLTKKMQVINSKKKYKLSTKEIQLAKKTTFYWMYLDKCI